MQCICIIYHIISILLISFDAFQVLGYLVLATGLDIPQFAGYFLIHAGQFGTI